MLAVPLARIPHRSCIFIRKEHPMKWLAVTAALFLVVIISGCAKKEIDANANAQFKSDSRASNRSMQESMEKGGQQLRPEDMMKMMSGMKMMPGRRGGPSTGES